MPIILPPTVVVGDPIWEFDPVSEDAANANLELTGNYHVTQFSAPMPQPDVLYASSVDTEGENPASVRFRNRTINLTVDVDGTGALSDLEYKVAKMIREKGTLKYTTKGGEVIVFDVLAVDTFDVPTDDLWLLGDVATVQLSFTCKPLGRGPEVDLGDNVETTLPWLVFTEAAVTGTWPGLGRLVIDNDVATDQWWVVWGIQSRFYSSATSAALGWEAESLTAMGGSATAAGPSGASGGGSNVMRNTALATSYQAILSTQATGGGAHMSHVGAYRVFARVHTPTTNQGTVSVALEWGEGDFRRFTENATATVPYEGSWFMMDLGLVSLTKVVQGTQRWEGRVLARSTAVSDDIDVDWLLLVPVTDGSADVSGVFQLPSPTAFAARDEFDQTAGSLTGKTLPVGGTWAGAGDADDFTIDTTTATAQRVAVSDTTGPPTGRFAIAGSTNYTNIAVRASGSHSAQGAQWGVFARYTDTNNFLLAYVEYGNNQKVVNLRKYVAGVSSLVVRLEYAPVAAGTTETMQMQVDTSGRVRVWSSTLTPLGSSPLFEYQDADLATGGTLATGKPGFYDQSVPATANTRTYDNFMAWAPPASDAAIFASQSLEVRADSVYREDSTGTLWPTPSRYRGDYLTVPVSGAEGRTIRMVVKASRGEPGRMPDGGTDDVSARLFVRPRYLAVPE